MGVRSRQKLGKTRRLDVRHLSTQQQVRNGDVRLYKITREENPGDLFTKAHRIVESISFAEGSRQEIVRVMDR